jgi:hypothetical protein
MFLTQNLEVPFTFASDEEIPAGAKRIQDLFKHSGFIFQNQNQGNGMQHDYVTERSFSI